MPEARDSLKEEGGDEQVKTAREQRVVTCVALTAFIFQFEAFLVNVSLPDMAREMHVSSTSVSFVVIAYLLAASAAFVPMGYLGEHFGMRKVFLSGCIVATLGTLLSGVSVNLEMLWCSRFIQGAGMGAMVSIGYAIIPMMVRKQRVGWGYGMLTLGAASGMVLGLPAGGLWSQFFSWHWVFLGTAPLLLLLLVFGWMIFPKEGGTKGKDEQLHLISFLPFTLFLIAVVLAFSLGNLFGWTSIIVMTAGVTSCLSFVALLLQRRYGSHPYPSEKILQSQRFATSLGVLFIFQATVGGVVFLIPFYLELRCHLPPLGSSLVLLVYPTSLAINSLLGGRMADHMDARPLIVTAVLIGSIVCGLFSMSLGLGNIIIALLFLLLFGITTGLFFPPNNRFAMSCVAPNLHHEASALLPVALNMGSVIGIALYNAIFTRNIPDILLSINSPVTNPSQKTALLNQGFSQAFLGASAVMLIAAVVAYPFYRPDPSAGDCLPDK